MKKTNEEIQALKDNWRRDPCWDIEDTEGFEEHREELIAWREELESKLDEEKLMKMQERFEKVRVWTGIDDADLAQHLWTFDEIESSLRQGERFSDNPSDCIAAAHARATLLLAAQAKRLVDLLENISTDGGLMVDATITDKYGL